MSEFEDKLNHILSDPQEMEKISRLAAQLMGGAPPSDVDGAVADGLSSGAPSIDLPGNLKAMLGSAGAGGDKAALLNALAPYLQQERRLKLQKALRLAQAARIAGVALRSYGGDDGV